MEKVKLTEGLGFESIITKCNENIPFDVKFIINI
jgi:hypothetical protein